VRSWKPEVFVEGKWAANGLRFATKEEAEASGIDLLLRWNGPSDSRAVASEDYPNYRLEDGRPVALCSEGACGLDAVKDGHGLCKGHHRLGVQDSSAEIAANN